NGPGAGHGLAITRDRRLIEEEAGHARVDAVGQAAGAPGHGQRGVALGVQLAQAAWLVARGHEQEGAAGEQAAGFGFVETDTRGELPGMTSGTLAQLLF